jgi:hypothetical protein
VITNLGAQYDKKAGGCNYAIDLFAVGNDIKLKIADTNQFEVYRYSIVVNTSATQ